MRDGVFATRVRDGSDMGPGDEDGCGDRQCRSAKEWAYSRGCNGDLQRLARKRASKPMMAGTEGLFGRRRGLELGDPAGALGPMGGGRGRGVCSSVRGVPVRGHNTAAAAMVGRETVRAGGGEAREERRRGGRGR